VEHPPVKSPSRRQLLALTSRAPDRRQDLRAISFYRPILWIGDLVRAIRQILETARGHGVAYNLASYNSTAEECANDVATWTGVEIERRSSPPGDSSKLRSTAYDFAISTDAFRKILDFEFEGTPSDILKELDLYYPQAHLATRDRPIPYG